jgi:hypothetical protein
METMLCGTAGCGADGRPPRLRINRNHASSTIPARITTGVRISMQEIAEFVVGWQRVGSGALSTGIQTMLRSLSKEVAIEYEESGYASKMSDKLARQEVSSSIRTSKLHVDCYHGSALAGMKSCCRWKIRRPVLHSSFRNRSSVRI